MGFLINPYVYSGGGGGGYAGPTYQALGTKVFGSTGSSLAWPTHLTNDIGIIAYVARGNDTELTTPTGWTDLGTVQSGGSSNNAQIQLFWKQAASASEANVDIGALGGSDDGMAQMITVRGGTTVTSLNTGSATNTSVSISGAAASDDALIMGALGTRPTTGGDNLSSWTNADVTITDRGGADQENFGTRVSTEWGTGELETATTIAATTGTLGTGEWAGFVIEVT